MPKKLTIKCPKCRGTGRAPLPRALLDTYTMLLRFGNGITAAAVAEKLSLNKSAANNRLEKLRKMGLAARRFTPHELYLIYTPIP